MIDSLIDFCMNEKSLRAALQYVDHSSLTQLTVCGIMLVRACGEVRCDASPSGGTLETIHDSWRFNPWLTHILLSLRILWKMMKGGNMCTLLNFSTQYSGEKKKQIVNSDILETVRYLSEEDGDWGVTFVFTWPLPRATNILALSQIKLNIHFNGSSSQNNISNLAQQPLLNLKMDSLMIKFNTKSIRNLRL